MTTNLNQPKLVILTGNPSGAPIGGSGTDTDGGGGTPQGNGLTMTILTLPSNGTLTDLNGTPVSAMQTFNAVAEMVYTPNLGFSGADSFSYEVAEDSVIDNAIVSVTVLANDNCAQVGRAVGCSPP